MKSIEDILYPLLKIYSKMPLTIKNVFGNIYKIIPYKLRYGSFYYRYQNRINQFESVSHENKQIEIDLLLNNQVRYAINNIPFYKKYDNCVKQEDFKNLPVINKNIISNNIEDFLYAERKYKVLLANTGGSSGTPFIFYKEKGVTRSKEAAHFNWYWGQYGYKKDDKVLMIRGKSLLNNALYEYQAIDNKLIVSSYNINQKTINEIYHQIIKFNPKFIHAYPSSLSIFTKELHKFLNDNNTTLNIQSIFLGSEFLYDEDKKYFETYYQTNIVNWYGHSECLIHGGRCEISGDYHFYPFYGYLELLDKNDNPIEIPGIEGRIVATGFDNKVMPLIRYDTGDIGVLSENKQCDCGFFGTSLSKIIGRGKDIIFLSDSTKVTLTAFIFGQHHAEFDKIKEMQIIQNEYGKIILRIVPLFEIKSKEINKLKERMIGSVNKGMLSVEIEIVNEIEKTQRGKHKLLIQNIEIE